MTATVVTRAARGARQQAAVPVLVFRAAFAAPFGEVWLYGTASGLVALALPGVARAAVEARLRRLLGPLALRDGVGQFADVQAQLRAYCAGTRRAFDVPLDLRGTAFQQEVWAAVAAIPYGETRSYSEIARAIGRPAAVRAVGAANGANPLPPMIPCHRVVGASGGLTGYAGGLDVKRRLLALEQHGVCW